jgi:plasmid maintenance system antidote protein VapI
VPNPSLPAASPGDFRRFLQQELVRRCRGNPRYSLRSFARALSIEPSALSKILRGRRAVTPAMFASLSQKLALTAEQAEALRPAQPVLRALARGAGGDEPAEPSDSGYRQLTLDTFHLISDWYHYAILELTAVRQFEPDARWVARALGLSVAEAQEAVERLVRLGFLKVERGRWVDCSDSVTTVGNEFTAAAFRQLQRQVLEMALGALEDVPLEQRDQSSMTMAINSRRLPEAKERIKRFRRQLCAFLQAGGSKDRVYQLGISLYPVSRPQGGRR